MNAHLCLPSEGSVGVHSGRFRPDSLLKGVHAVLGAVQQGLIHEVVVVLQRERMEKEGGTRGEWKRMKDRNNKE